MTCATILLPKAKADSREIRRLFSICPLDRRKKRIHASFMSGIRTHLRPFALLCALAAPAAVQAQTDIPDDPLRFFATCTGRLSALMEHQWLVDGPASDATKARRASLIEVVEAMMPPGSEAQVMAWRVEAKAAHATLLGQSRHGTPAAMARAAHQAQALEAACTAYLS
jgi:hypothetical protein